MTDLKPCPFCGGEVRFVRNPISYIAEIEHIEDVDCILNVMESCWSGDREPFIAEWNKREGEDRARDEGFREAMKRYST